jgi:hypothetical protein
MTLKTGEALNSGMVVTFSATTPEEQTRRKKEKELWHRKEEGERTLFVHVLCCFKIFIPFLSYARVCTLFPCSLTASHHVI